MSDAEIQSAFASMSIAMIRQRITLTLALIAAEGVHCNFFLKTAAEENIKLDVRKQWIVVVLLVIAAVLYIASAQAGFDAIDELRSCFLETCNSIKSSSADSIKNQVNLHQCQLQPTFQTPY